MAEPARARPKPTPETQHFWDGTQAGELRLQRCDACANVYFPPRPFCPACASRKVSVFKASGKAKLYSYVIHHRPVPGFTPPYAIAVVELDEGPRMMSNIVDCPQTPEALELDMKLEVAFEKARRQDHASLVPSGEGISIMRRNQVAVVGAAETTELGVIPNVSQIQLHADAALNAIADAGLKLSDIDGFATAVETPQQIAHYLGITPTWVDGTSVGGCSFMLHVRHAAAAIEAGLCKTVLITHAESGKSNIGRTPRMIGPDSLNGQFELPYGVSTPASMFPIPVLRYMKTHGITHEQIAMVAVVQREWAAKNPRATMKAPITVEDVLNSRMIAYPFRILQCCLVTDGGGALILTSADRAKDFPKKPVYILGTGESVETPMVSQMQTFDSSRAFRVAGPLAFREAGITHKDVDHLMIYDAFAHLPLYGLGDLGFMPHEETGKFIADGHTRPGGKLPLNTNGGGLSYMHSGMYGMYALQESVRQMRGTAPAQVPGAKISVCHGVGGMFAASGTIIFTNER